MKQQTKALCTVLLAGILWGCIGLFANQLSAGGLDSLQITALRAVLGALIFLIAGLLRGPKRLKIRLKDTWMFFGMGILSVVLFNVCYFDTMIHSEVSAAVVLLYTSPAFVMLLSALIFRERVTGRRIAALLLTAAGCVLVAGLIGSGVKLTPRVLLTGLGSGFFYALYTIFGRAALAKYETQTVTVWTFLFAAAGSVPIAEAGSTVSLMQKAPMLLLWAVGITVFCTVLPYFFYTWGLQRMDAGKAAILVAVEPMVGALLGMTVLHESHGITKLTGVVLILAAVILLGTEREKAQPPHRACNREENMV